MNIRKNFKRTLSLFLIMSMVLPAISTLGAFAATKKTAFTSATAPSATSVSLKWKKISSINGYEIYQKKAGETYKKIKTIESKNTVSCKISKLTSATKYTYKIRTYKTVKKKKQYSSFSAEKSVTTKPTAPILTSALSRDNIVKVQWKKVNGAKGYIIYLKNGNKNSKIKSASASATSVTVEAKIGDLLTARAYLTDGKKNVYSDYSKEIKVEKEIVYVTEEDLQKSLGEIKTLLENSYVTDEVIQQRLDEISNMFSDSYVTKDMFDEYINNIKETITNNYVSKDQMNEYLENIKDTVTESYETYVNNSIDELKTLFEKTYVSDETAQQYIEDLKKLFADGYVTKEQFDECITDIRETLTKDYITNEKMEEYLENIKDTVTESYETYVNNSIDELKKLFENTYVSDETAQQYIEDLKKLFADGYVTKEQFDECITDIRETLTKDYITNEKMEEYLENIKDTVTESYETYVNNSIDELKTLFEKTYVSDETAQQYIEDLKKLFADNYVTKDQLDVYLENIKETITENCVTKEQLDKYLDEYFANIKDSITEGFVTEKQLREYLDNMAVESGKYEYVDITDTLTIEKCYYGYWNGEKLSYDDAESCYIAVTPGDRFKVTGYSVFDVSIAIFFDKNGNHIYDTSYINVEGKSYHDELIIIPQDCYYVAFGSYILDGFQEMRLKVKKRQATEDETTNKNNDSILYEKSMYAIGDSIAEGAEAYSYIDSITNQFAMSTNKEAKSGTTLAVIEGSNDSICERILAMDTTKQYDYILIEGGFNDLLMSVEIGEITNPHDFGGYYDKTTVIGAMETICYYLVNNYYESKKLFVLGHKCFGFWDAQIEYWDAIKSVLEKWGIPYVDLRKESNLCKRTEVDPVADKYFVNGDGIHPTKEAYEIFYVPLIKVKLEDL